MNIEKNLILIKNKDKTEKVTYCSKIKNGKRDVTFENNDTYTYNSCNVLWSTKCTEIDPKTVIIYEKGIPISSIIKIIKFEDLGYIRIIKKGYHKLYHNSELDIQKNSLEDSICKDCFTYLKELSGNINFENDSDFISKQYEYMTAISPDSVLSKYLNPKTIKKVNHCNQIIFPFGFNISQKEATEKALKNQISIIEGPPGTGKTQTILNIIANAVMEEKTVAVVSNNNSATLNVFEKLKKYNVDFIAAYLGNKQNRNEFFQAQDGRYPDMSNYKLEDEKFQNIKDDLVRSQKSLEEMLEKKNKLAVLKAEKSNLITENGHFEKYGNQERFELSRSLPRQSADKIMSLLMEYNMLMGQQGYIKFSHKLKFLLTHSIWNFRFYDNSPEIIEMYLKQLYYKLKLNELDKEIKSLENVLDRYNFDNEMKKYSENSKLLLKHTLYKRFNKSKERTVFNDDVLCKNFGAFIRQYPVILSTTHSLRRCASENYLFDYVIIDEASQVDIITGALAFSCAKNVVIVGDLKQLPNVVNNKTKEISDRIYNKYKLNEAYKYSENTLLSSICNLFNDVPKTLLKEHYRCHPKIVDFCNKKFYDDQLIILTDESSCDTPLEVYRTVKGNHERNHYNQRQIDVIVKEILPQVDESKSIGIATPYNKQIEKLKNEISDEHIEIDTIHKYQGREKEIIILSTVSDKYDEFMDNANLLNGAISRAENKLIIIVSDNEELFNNSNIGDLIRYIEYSNLEITNSNIYSIFDLLYSSYSEKLLDFYKKNKKVSKYDSENLMNALIEKVLTYEEFKSLDKVLHYPLNMLIRDTSKLNEKELKYVTNSLTHTDFLIFRKIDKVPVLVVEVDGYAFHANNTKQLERDRMKDMILEKYDIPILRLATNDSGEEEKLRGKLSKIMNI
ncbi:AAA domain-containing protein [Clostridium beijerinckii]|uniref:AAA family ATPase n=1 Tax=Clostridium beijerinckii TaxID=1520 RepID=A0A7X9XPM2_CLOBE|nr:AAA domain-containing protein [Clostridium beijerinckii]NMF05116.1 AAA family ATPase [Clostridium beijerinckii]